MAVCTAISNDHSHIKADDSKKVFVTPNQARQRSRPSFCMAFNKIGFWIPQRIPSKSSQETMFGYPCYNTKLIPRPYSIKSCGLRLV
jgi:hypothetical protein